MLTGQGKAIEPAVDHSGRHGSLFRAGREHLLSMRRLYQCMLLPSVYPVHFC